MSRFARAVIVVVLGVWTLGTLAPQMSCIWQRCPSDGLSTDFDGVVDDVQPGSPAAQASIAPGDRVVPPLPRDLFRQPSPPISLKLLHAGTIRSVYLIAQPSSLTLSEKLRLFALCASYLIFLVVGSALLLLRPSPMTWSFYLFCFLRRYGDLWFYLPGPGAFFWVSYLFFAILGGANCALVTIFALRFPSDRLEGWRRPAARIAVLLAILFPLAWLYVFWRVVFMGLPTQAPVSILVFLTSIVYVCAATIFIVTLVLSRGDARHRLQWILVFPFVLVMRVVAINLPDSLAPWSSDVLVALAVLIPLTVAYAVIRRRVFDVEFVVSRAMVYGSITTIVAGTFLLLDWFMSRQFAATRFTLTAEIIVALALGSSLNLLHRNVDRFVDRTFFRQRHLAEQRLTKAAAAVIRAESLQAVDKFLVHEPVKALDLTSAAIFHRDEDGKSFLREVTVGFDRSDVRELTSNDSLVLHLLAEEEPVRLADIAWSTDELPALGNAVLAVPVLLREHLLSIVLYGPHRNGADIDPDEVRSIAVLVERAGAAYDHIEARTLQARVDTLRRECEARDREIEALQAEAKSLRNRSAPESPSTA